MPMRSTAGVGRGSTVLLGPGYVGYRLAHVEAGRSGGPESSGFQTSNKKHSKGSRFFYKRVRCSATSRGQPLRGTGIGRALSPQAPLVRTSARQFAERRRRAGRRTRCRSAASSTTRRHAKLREALASRPIEQGANILLVSRIAGHAKPSVTLDVYSHLFADGIEEAAARFDPLAGGRREVDDRVASGG